MEKSRSAIIISFLLVFIIINFCLYKFYIEPSIETLNNKKVEYEEKTNKVEKLIAEKNEIEKLEIEIGKLKNEIKEIDKLVPHSADTPQMIYDFYNACEKYNVSGETISFEINEEEKEKEDKTISNTEEKGNEENNTNKFRKLEIKLDIVGEKENLFKFISNINNITERKINVKTINIGSYEKAESNNEEISQDENKSVDDILEEIDDIQNQVIGNGNDISNNPGLETEITFYYYIQLDEKAEKELKEYEFYKKPMGFNNVFDMFK